jgi:hypothetical protein
VRNLIVLIHINHPNDVESARSSRQTFATFGYELREFSVSNPNAGVEFSDLMRDHGHEIFMFLSANYYALGIRDGEGRPINQITGIPLVIMMHDHPLYFLSQQVEALKGTVAFVPGEDSRQFVMSHYPVPIAAIANTGSLPQVSAEEPDYEQFLSRANTILAPMNLAIGASTMDSAWQQIKHLPEPRRTAAIRLVEAALTECAIPLDQIATPFRAGLPVGDAVASIADQLLVLTFLKLWRRNRIIRALIDLPILISTEFVPADLELKYPKKFTLLSMEQTIPLYRRYRFTLNSHPLLTTLLHDRILTSVAQNTACITDVNAAVARFFHDGDDAIFYDYSDAAPERIAMYLDDPERAYGITVRAAATRIATADFDYRRGYATLIDTISAHWGQSRLVETI